VGCYIWYSDEGTGGRGRSPPRPLLAVPNVTAHLSTAGVLITVLLYNVPLLCGFCVPIKGLNWCRLLIIKFSVSCTVRSCTVMTGINWSNRTILSTILTKWVGQDQWSFDVGRGAVEPLVRNGRLIKPPPQEAWALRDGDMLLFVWSFVRLSVCQSVA